VPANLSGEPPGRGRLPTWLQEKLFERRIVFVTGRLDVREALEYGLIDAISTIAP